MSARRGASPDAPTVCVVIPTYDRRELLLECLAALAAQTRPVDRVIVIDNASSDGTLEALSGDAAARRLDVGYVELAENAGASGGFAEGVTQALSEGADWLWLIDNDCAPVPDALERLLAAPQAAAPDTAALCAGLRGRDGHWQTEYRGNYRGGLARALPERSYDDPAVAIDYAAFAGLLVRGSAAAAAGPPKSEFFIWVDDLEWCLRLHERGAIWLIPASVVIHKDENPQIAAGRLASLRRSLRAQPDAQIWKHIYCFRNISWVRRTYDGERSAGFAWHLAQHWVRVILFDRCKLRRMRWYLEYGLAGRRGKFANAPPSVWAQSASRRGGRRAVRVASRPAAAPRRVRGPFDPTAPAGRETS